MSNIWQPNTLVESNRVIELNRGNQSTWTYRLASNRSFPAGSSASLKLSNTYGQLIGTWDGSVEGGVVTFDEPSTVVDGIPAGTSWQMFVDADGAVRLVAQGMVIRTEAPYPDAPPKSSEYDGVRYQYAFGTPGFLYDPAWRIISGQPRVYDNSGRSLPNGCAAGSLAGGDLSIFGKSSMLYFAPLRTDAVRLTYNTVRNGANSNGTLISVICSNYDMSNWVGFRHYQTFGIGQNGQWDNDSLSIVVGSSPVDYVIKDSAYGDTSNNSYYTGEYNPVSNTYTLWKGTTPVVDWTDSTNIVSHGAGERYVGFHFQAALLNSGVQVSDWLIGDAP